MNQNNIFSLVVFLFIFSQCKENETSVNISNESAAIDFDNIRMILDSIHVEDQKYRAEIEEIVEEHGWDSEEMGRQWYIISKKDSSNLVIVEEILKTHGWVSADKIGKTANSTLFLVIQHSNQETQEKYLPMMRQAVKEDKASPGSLALLEDRVALGKGELQIYGSQVGRNSVSDEEYVLPLIDPDNVNERRAEVGLQPIEDYIAHWQMEWDVEDYKKRLPGYIEILKAEKM